MLRLWLLLIVLLAARLLISLQEEIFNLDEGTISSIAAVMLDGGTVYRDAASNRGPWTYGLYWLVAEAFGPFSLMPVRILAWIWGAVTVGLLAVIVGRLETPRAGLIAACCYTAFSTFYLLPMDGLAFNSSYMMVLPQLVGVTFLVGKQEPGRIRFLCAGIAVAIAGLFKQVALVDVAFFALLPLVLYGRRLDRDGIIAVVRAGIFLMLGVGIVMGLTHLYFYSLNAHEDFVFFFYEYGFNYYTKPVTLFVWIDSLFTGLFRLFRQGPIGFVVLGLFALDLAMRARSRGRLNWDDFTRTERFAILWIAIESVGVSTGGRFFGHYFLQTLAPLSLIAALTIPRVLDFLRLGGREDRGVPIPTFIIRRNCALAFVLTALLLVAPVITRDLNGLLGNDLRRIVGLPDREIQDYEKVGNYIRSRSKPDDYILVWGLWSEIYHASHRRPVTKFAIYNYLTGLQPWANYDQDTRDLIVPGTWKRLMAELNSRHPLYIVEPSGEEQASRRDRATKNRPISLYPMLDQVVQGNYQSVHEIGEFKIYRRQSGTWKPVPYDPARVVDRLHPQPTDG